MYIALDLETTGFSPINDGIIEIGMVQFDDSGEEIASLTTLVNPYKDIHPKAQEVHGISASMIANAPGVDDIRDLILAFIGDHTLVGHNILKFDLLFLKKHYLYNENLIIDTLERAKERLGQPKNSLSYLSEYFSLPTPPTHRALDDARAVKELFFKL